MWTPSLSYFWRVMVRLIINTASDIVIGVASYYQEYINAIAKKNVAVTIL